MTTFKLVLAFCMTLFATFALAANVEYTMDLTWEIGAPDGNPRYMVMNNGGFPGPELLLDEGDDVKVCEKCVSRYIPNLINLQITVNNKMPFNTSIHWHGLT